MTSVTLTDPVDGTTITVAWAATNNAALRSVINGNLDDANIKSAAGIQVAKFAPGVNGQVLGTLGGVTQWVNAEGFTLSAWSGGPPGSPNDTDIWIATAVDANGTRWMFQYNSGSASASKWEFIGGTPIFVADATGTGRQNTVDSTWEVIAGMPSFALSRSGQYRYKWGGLFTGNNANNTYVQPGTTAGAGLGTNAQAQINVGSTLGANILFPFGFTSDDAKNGITRAAASTINLQMQSTSHTNVTLSNCWLEITPLRVA